MSPSAQQLARHQQVNEELCAASLRALTGERRLHYAGRRIYQGGKNLPIHAPHLRQAPDNFDFVLTRAAADGVAMRVLFGDAQLHRDLCPSEPVERLMFEWLEQLRVESLVDPNMLGVQANLHSRFLAWSRDFYRMGHTKSRHGMLLYTAAQMCWSRLMSKPVLEETEDYIEGTRGTLAPLLGHCLTGLRRHRHDQALFANHARELGRLLAQRMQQDFAAADDDEDKSDASANKVGIDDLLEFEEASDEPDTAAMAASGVSKVWEQARQQYKVFTARYDLERQAADLVRAEQLRADRERLDQLVSARGIHVFKLARALMAVLAQPARDDWHFGQEQGRIDGARLGQLVSSPTERRLFKAERFKPHADCLVTFLLDCSGSMKAHIEPLATVVDIMLRALDMAGVATELLGFTTGAWQGGRAMKDWRKQGQPSHPGRLNEVQHLVFKQAHQSWRRSRRDIAALFKLDMYREGIDGEAVDWACERSLSHDCERRMLIVVSDGCPADGATALANDAFYLDNHLKSVVARREQQGQVEVMGLGVGLDLSPFYRRCLATDLTRPIDNELFAEIVQLLGGRHHR